MRGQITRFAKLNIVHVSQFIVYYMNLDGYMAKIYFTYYKS